MGAIELKKGLDGFQASPGTVLFGVDLNGNPVTKDENGVVSSSATLDGSPASFNNQLSDPAAELAKIKLYAKDVSGVSEMFVRDSAGNIVQMTSAGAPAGGGGGGSGVFATPAWKADVVGNPYINGDTINAQVGNIYALSVGSGDSITFQLPTAAGVTGQIVGFANYINLGNPPSGGEITVTPQAGEVIAFYIPGGSISIGRLTHGFFMSDGDGRWEPIILSSYLAAIAPI